jgi:hypothetical protein
MAAGLETEIVALTNVPVGKPAAVAAKGISNDIVITMPGTVVWVSIPFDWANAEPRKIESAPTTVAKTSAMLRFRLLFRVRIPNSLNEEGEKGS